MHARTFKDSQRGYTLMEILVAVAIFATVMIVALLLYDQSNRVFKQSTESAEMQQNTRVAFEKVVADLRMAGFDYKRAGTPLGGTPEKWKKDTDYAVGMMVTPDPPNGHVYRATKGGKSGSSPPAWKTGTGDIVDDGTVKWQEAGAPFYEQPDEQIEFVHPAAITIRANFDYEDPTTTDKGREPDLEESSKGHFPIVTTGNDEIVTYALVSRSGNANANKDTISFFADVQVKDGKPSREAYPGGKVEKEIKITGVDLTNQYPPYTLMRYTLNAQGEPVGTALADNIRSMQFSYFQDSAGKQPLTDWDNNVISDFSTLGGLGQYNPNNVTNVKERLIRGKIRTVTASIVGMNPQPDRDYTHPTDTVARNYRQYTLQSTIVGRNLGLEGMPQTDTNPPGPPTIKTACTGYCGVVFLTWAPAPNSGDVTYTVLYDTSASGSFSGVLPAGSQTSYAVELTQLDLSKTYYFRVAATNAAGTTVSTGNPLAVSLKNVTEPKAPVIKGVTFEAKANEIDVVFAPQSGNAAGAPSCTSGSPVQDSFASEIQGYRIYRSTDPAFKPGDTGSELVHRENDPGLVADAAGNITFTDRDLVNCEVYYYRVAAVEWCALKNDYNTPADLETAISDYSAVSGKASAKTTIKPKAPTQVRLDVSSFCDPDANRCDPVTIHWDKVIRDVNDAPIRIQEYNVYRTTSLKGVPVGQVLVGTVTDGTTSFTDQKEILLEHAPFDPSVKYSYEYSVHAEHCEVEGAGVKLTYPGACATGAQIVPDADGPGSGLPDDPLQNVNALILKLHADKEVKSVAVSVDGSAYEELKDPYEFVWDIQDGEVHRVTFKVTADCTELLSIYVQADAADCALRTAVYNVTDSDAQLKVTLTNISDKTVLLDSMAIRWAGQSGFSWSQITLPSGTPVDATFTAPATAASARTVIVKPSSETDKKIEPGKTYTMTLTFTGSATVGLRAGPISLPEIDYHELNDATQFGCAPQGVACSVVATPSVSASGDKLLVNIKNNSTTEALTVTALRLEWRGQTNWQWLGVTAGVNTTTFATPVTAAATRDFPNQNFIIPPDATVSISMNMDRTKNNAANLDETQLGKVYVQYTTQPTEAGQLNCRAR